MSNEGSRAKLHSLTEFVSGNNKVMESFKLLHMDCFGLHCDYPRSLFDRGKCTVISSLTYEKFILQLLLSLGYGLDLRFINSFPRLCVTNVAFLGAKKMFVQMPERDRLLLLLWFDSVITTDTSYENLASSKDIIVLDNKLNCKDCVTLLLAYTRSLFDRGKEIVFGLRTSCFTCSEILSKMDVCMILLGDYYRIFVPELIPEHDYWSASWSHGVSSATWQMLDEIFEIDIVCLKSKNVSSVQSLIDGRVFDRGKEFGTSPGCSYFTGGCEFSSALPASCLFVLHVCSFLRDANKRNLAYKLFLRHGFRSHSSSMNYILLVFKTGDLGDIFLGCLQMLAMCRTVIFLLQLEFCLFHEIAVHCLDSLVVNQIHFVSFECVFKVLMFNTFTILHHGFLYLQSWSLFHIVIWIHMDQGTWFNQLAGTSAFFSQASSQMSQVVSSAGVFSYENLIFVLIPSLGYHSDFSAIHLHVLLCITDADIVDGTLTVTMAARTGNLSHLAESLAWGLRGGDAIAFILSELWEIRAREQEHKEWLPKPTAVNLLVCTDAHLQLNVLTFEAYERFSISDGVACYVEKHCNTRSQNFKVNYFYMLLTQLPSCTIDFTKVYFCIYIHLITSLCASLPTAEFLRIIFDRGKDIEPVEKSSVVARHISKFHLTSCWVVSKGLIFTDACAGKSAIELILEFGCHLILFIGVLNVPELVIAGTRCDAGQLVNDMPQQAYILWSIGAVSVGMSTYPAGGVDHYGPAVYHGQHSTTKFWEMVDFTERTPTLWSFPCWVFYRQWACFSQLFFSHSLATWKAETSDAYHHVPA